MGPKKPKNKNNCSGSLITWEYSLLLVDSLAPKAIQPHATGSMNHTVLKTGDRASVTGSYYSHKVLPSFHPKHMPVSRCCSSSSTKSTPCSSYSMLSTVRCAISCVYLVSPCCVAGVFQSNKIITLWDRLCFDNLDEVPWYTQNSTIIWYRLNKLSLGWINIKINLASWSQLQELLSLCKSK